MDPKLLDARLIVTHISLLALSSFVFDFFFIKNVLVFFPNLEDITENEIQI